MANSTHYHVFFLDVGQGDSTLIVKRVISDNGEVECSTLLVDTCHGTVNTINLIKDCIPKVTKNDKEVHHIHGKVITHPHDDHIKGLNLFVNDVDILVSKIFHPDYDFMKDRESADYKAYNKLRKDTSKQSETRLIAGKEYGADIGILFTAISPPQTIEYSETFKAQPEKIQVHNHSAVIIVDLNGTKLLFLGDANKECMKRLVKHHKDRLPAFILSASHHGSNSLFVPEIEIEENLSDIKRGDTDSDWDEEFLSIINPTYVVISSGKDNKYKHPHSAALQAYKEDGRIVKRTDEDATIYFIVDSDGSCTSPTSLKTYDDVRKKVKSLFPVNAKTDSSVSSFFIGSSALPVPPRNA